MKTNSWVRHYIDFMHSLDEYWKVLEYDYINDSMYEVSTMGRLRYRASKEIIVPFNNMGYEIVSLRDYEYDLRNIGIHRLVANAFCPGRSEEQNDVNHINCIKDDNRFMNLEWCTTGDNNRHGHEHNLMRNPLSPAEKMERYDDIIKIRDSLIKNGGRAYETYKEFKDKLPWFSYYIACDIKMGKTYTDMTGFTEDTFAYTILQDLEVHLICQELIKEKGCIKNVVDKLSPEHPLITYPVVDNIKRCHTHRDISKQYFDRGFFEMRRKLTNKEILIVAETAKKYSGYGASTNTLAELKPIIPDLTINQVRNIMDRKTHKDLLKLFDDGIIKITE